MGKGIDCATPLTSAVLQRMVDDGVSFACRYLTVQGAYKRLSAAEAQLATYYGIWLVSVFERTAIDALGGASKGTENGLIAFTNAQEIGQPEGSTIYAAVDTDVNSSHYDVIEEYLRAFDAEIPGYELGIYGEKDICEEMLRRGVVTKVWQTRAWSRGQVMEDYNLYQYDLGDDGLGRAAYGITVDFNMSNGDAGGWQVGMALKKQHVPSQADGQQIILILKKYHDEMAEFPDVQAYVHHLADEVRLTCDLPADE